MPASGTYHNRAVNVNQITRDTYQHVCVLAMCVRETHMMFWRYLTSYWFIYTRIWTIFSLVCGKHLSMLNTYLCCNIPLRFSLLHYYILGPILDEFFSLRRWSLFLEAFNIKTVSYTALKGRMIHS